MRGHVHRRAGCHGQHIHPLIRHIGHICQTAHSLLRVFVAIFDQVGHPGDPKLPREHPDGVFVQGEESLSLFQLSMELFHGAGRFVEPFLFLPGGHQVDDPAVAMPARPTLPLESSCRRGYGIEADDEVDVGNVEAFLSDAGRNEQVAGAGGKVGQHLLLLALLHARLPLATTLADEHLGTYKRAHGLERVGNRRNTVPQ
mmetsp:Transcript_13955/g.40053  ORF Transcript_13955/g.40053 Transcript_13955/m.40053 type:complete len:200 (-) Transcript_13955:67-666(-)